MNAGWTRQQLEEMMDKVIEGLSSEQIARHMTRKFRHRFTRSAIIGMMNREFGGSRMFLYNFVTAWPDDPKSAGVRSVLESNYKLVV